MDETAQDGLEDVKAKLLMLGFPEEVLNDLTPEDLEAWPDGVEVVVEVTGETFSEDGRGTGGAADHRSRGEAGG